METIVIGKPQYRSNRARARRPTAQEFSELRLTRFLRWYGNHEKFHVIGPNAFGAMLKLLGFADIYNIELATDDRPSGKGLLDPLSPTVRSEISADVKLGIFGKKTSAVKIDPV